MPRNSESSKVLRAKLIIEALEDRSLPGNTILGMAGFQNPLSFLGNNISKLSLIQSSRSATTPASLVSQHKASASTPVKITNPVQLVANRSGAAPATTPTRSTGGLTQIDGGTSSPLGSSGITQDGIPTSNQVDAGVYYSSTAPTVQATARAGTVKDTASQDVGELTSILGQYSGLLKVRPVPGSQPAAAGLTNSTGTQATDDSHAGTYDLRVNLLQANGPRSLNAQQLQAINTLKASVPGLQFTVNKDLGTLGQIFNLSGPLTASSTSQPLQVLKNYLNQNSSIFGMTATEVNQLTATQQYKWNNTGFTVLHVQQKAGGIPIFGAISTASIATNGSLVGISTNFVPGSVATPNTTTPTLTALNAIQRAAQDSSSYLGINLSASGTVLTANTGGVERISTYNNANLSIDPIPVRLNYVAVQPGDMRLAWNLRIFIPNSTYYFEYNIDARTGEVLTRHNWIKADSYRVYATPVQSPDVGPRTLAVNPADPLASPFGWHDTNGVAGAEYNYTRGNNTLTRESRNSAPGGFIGGNYAVGAPGNVYDFPLNISQDPLTYTKASTTNLFYWVNRNHDVMYKLGFNENAGNYQQNNYGRGGLAGDPIWAYTQAAANLGASDNAFFVPSPDGTAGRTFFFIGTWNPAGLRDFALSNEVTGHEIMHGTSTRLVGGAANVNELNTFESAGLGEGWSDFGGLFMTTNFSTTNKNTPRPMGLHVGGPIPGTPYDTGAPDGIRNYPYSYDMTINPVTFADVDYSQTANFDELGLSTGSYYQIGDVWASVLYDMMWNLVDKHGSNSTLGASTGGNNLAMKLVLAGQALAPASPSILEARNAIIFADISLTGGQNLYEIWSAFARRGMGIYAQDGVEGVATAPDGFDYQCMVGVVENFDLPPGLVPGGGGGGGEPVPTPGGDGSEDSLYEPNETSNRAFNLGTIGDTDVENLQITTPIPGRAQDRDWFKFKPTTSGSLTLTLEVANGTGDLDVRLYRSINGLPTSLTEVGVGQGTKRTPGQNEKITVNVTAGITYYLVVQGFNSNFGNYNLLINTPA